MKKKLRQPSEYQPPFLLAGQLLVSNFQKGGIKESGLKEFLPLIFAWGLRAYYVPCQKRLPKRKYGLCLPGERTCWVFQCLGEKKKSLSCGLLGRGGGGSIPRLTLWLYSDLRCTHGKATLSVIKNSTVDKKYRRRFTNDHAGWFPWAISAITHRMKTCVAK